MIAKKATTGNFWETLSIGAMSREQWESLCDGCGKCCLEKLEDEDTGEISYTSIACELLDTETCRCMKYPTRHQYVSDCIELSAKNISELKWMPSTCAYRLLAEGKPLPDWHPLLTGDAGSAITAGVSVRGRAVGPQDIEDFEEYIVTWPE